MPNRAGQGGSEEMEKAPITQHHHRTKQVVLRQRRRCWRRRRSGSGDGDGGGLSLSLSFPFLLLPTTTTTTTTMMMTWRCWCRRREEADRSCLLNSASSSTRSQHGQLSLQMVVVILRWKHSNGASSSQSLLAIYTTISEPRFWWEENESGEYSDNKLDLEKAN